MFLFQAEMSEKELKSSAKEENSRLSATTLENRESSNRRDIR